MNGEIEQMSNIVIFYHKSAIYSRLLGYYY